MDDDAAERRRNRIADWTCITIVVAAVTAVAIWVSFLFASVP